MSRSLTLLCLMFLSTAAQAQTVSAPAQPQQQEVGQKLQQWMRQSKKTNMGQVLATGMLLGCTQKQAGKEATQAFYNEIENVGKTVKAYCREGHAAEAKALVLSTLDAKKNDATLKAALNCYHTNQSNLDKMAGPQIAGDAARYVRWVENPDAARKEVVETDICKRTNQGGNV